MRKSYVGRRHVSWNEDSARKDYEVPEPSAPTRSPVKKNYHIPSMHGSCGVTKLRSLHQATLTTPHYSAIRVCAGIASAHSENRADLLLSNSNFSLREKTGTPSASPSRLRLLSLRSPAKIYALEFGERLPHQPNLPFSSGHHPPPLRSPDDWGSKGRP